jgi:phosphoribosylanthranilate isomerase
MFVKICGLNSAAAVEAAVTAGADALGFVFALSPREVTPELAATLCANVPASVIRVAVMRHPPTELWQRVLEVFAPDWLQTDAEDLAAIRLPPACRPLPVYRDNGAPADADLPDRLLFEGSVSGSGRRADWNEARGLARATEVILAGGLNADNVASAISWVQPWGVDVSSGVERQRGEKDPAKIKDFVARVRALQE